MHTDSGAAWLKSVFLLKCESIQPCLARGASTCVIVTMVNTAARIMANVYKYMYLCSYGEAINTSYKHYHVADKNRKSPIIPVWVHACTEESHL